MFSAAFIFKPGSYDKRVHALDTLIEAAARANPGFLGSETWHSEAKHQYQQWYKGFHSVISEVIRSYGDGAFKHVTPNSRIEKQS